MVIPCFILVVDDGCTKAPSRVDASASDWDSGQVHQEHSEPNRQGCQNLIRIIVTIIKGLYSNLETPYLFVSWDICVSVVYRFTVTIIIWLSSCNIRLTGT